MATSPSESSCVLPRSRLKICHLNRTKICGISPDLTFSELITLVGTAFPETDPAAQQRPASLEVTYLDKEGDVIIIHDDESLRSAFLDFTGPESYLKVQVHVKLQKEYLSIEDFKLPGSIEDVKLPAETPKRPTANLVRVVRHDERLSRYGRSQVLCRNFRAGFCKFGSSCWFSHALNNPQNRDRRTCLRPAFGNASNVEIKHWLMNRQRASGWDNIFYLSSADGFDDMKHILDRTNLSADIIHEFVMLLTREDIRTSQLRQATDKIYGALVGSVFLTHLRTHIQANLEPTAACIEPYLTMSEELLERRCNGWKETPVDELKQLVDELQTEDALTRKLHWAIARLLKQRQKKRTLNTVNDQLAASSSSTNFRNLPILPSKEQLICEKDIHLPENNIELMYRSVDAYLDMHFRFIQKDCTITLKEGVQELRRNSRDPKLCVYTNVRLVAILCGGDAMLYRVSFVDARRDVNWELSRNLMAGSLLCISHDRFQTFLWAVVAFRSAELLSQGLVGIQVLGESDQTLNINIEYTMAELFSYFKFYSHFLKKLQGPEMAYLPFQEHLISLEPHVQEPIYIKSRKDHDIYDFTSVFPDWWTELSTNKLHILQDWPRCMSSLDVSQTAALRHCLTKRLALIQGPPGTGKTFIGILIVRILLENLKTHPNLALPWNNTREQGKTIDGPILVVCHSNHVLDQLLKGVYTQKKNDVESGRQCEQLFKLVEGVALIKDWTTTQSLPECLYEEKNEVQRLKKSLDEKIHQQVDRLTGEHATIDSLQGIAKEEQIQCLFYDGCNTDGIIQMWLNEGEKEQVNSQSDCAVQNTCTVSYQEDLDQIGFSMQLKVEPRQRYGYQSDIEVHEGNSARESPGNLQSGAANFEDEDFLDGSVGINIPEKSRDSAILRSNGILDKYDNYTNLGPTEPDEGERQVGSLDKCLSSHKNPMMLQGNKIMDVQGSPYQEWIGATTNKKSGGKVEKENSSKMIANQQLDVREYECPLEILVNHMDVWSLDKHARRKLHNYWLEKIKDDAQNKIAQLSVDCEIACKRELEIDNEIHLSLLKKAKVVGMTTIAVACCQSLIEALKAEIVIVLEAAAVLKSYILACLTPSIKHLILIGDYVLFQSKFVVDKLAVEHHLDVSLFEQLIRSGIDHVTLEMQRRMSPCISKLISGLYPMLKDHFSVLGRENVKGVASNVFFLNHKLLEAENGDREINTVNEEEAKLVVELYAYLLKQGYANTDITILSTYNDQLDEIFLQLALKSSSHQSFEKQMPRVSSVDDYQGEECSIIILSLVKTNSTPSNDDPGRRGLLKICSYQIYVALSRARNGLFIFGNGELLAEKSDAWNTVIQELQISGSYGNELILLCQNHHGEETRIRKPDDFQEVADGGCNRPCHYQLECGHACPQKCHPYDHSQVVCGKRCPRKFPSCIHQCRSMCHGSRECPPCNEPIFKELPACGHSQRVPCSCLIESVVCTEPCLKILACGHKCSSSCGKACTSVCYELVDRSLPCGHVANIACYQDPVEYICRELCLRIPSPGCKHTCMGSCGSCKQGTEHIACRQKCGRILPCGHSCGAACYRRCPPCPLPCRRQCLHRRCHYRCGDLCDPCVECKELQCGHPSVGL